MYFPPDGEHLEQINIQNCLFMLKSLKKKNHTFFFSLTHSYFTPCSIHHHQNNTMVGKKKKNYSGRWKHKHRRHIEKIMKNETHTYLQNVREPCWQMGAAADLCSFHQITSSISRRHLLRPPHQIFSGALSLRQVGTSQITCRPVSHFKAKQQMSSLLFRGGVFLGLTRGGNHWMH